MRSTVGTLNPPSDFRRDVFVVAFGDESGRSPAGREDGVGRQRRFSRADENVPRWPFSRKSHILRVANPRPFLLLFPFSPRPHKTENKLNRTLGKPYRLTKYTSCTQTRFSDLFAFHRAFGSFSDAVVVNSAETAAPKSRGFYFLEKRNDCVLYPRPTAVRPFLRQRANIIEWSFTWRIGFVRAPFTSKRNTVLHQGRPKIRANRADARSMKFVGAP